MPICHAHRGYSGKYPENTMLAFEKALETGCAAIEMDVHLARDGVVVIAHDESLGRTTSGRGYIRDYTAEELKAFKANAGFWLDCPDQHISTLREYFERVESTSVITNIELKNTGWYYAGMEQAVIALVQEFGLESRVIFSSYNHASMLLCHQLAPEIKTGLLTGEPLIENVAEYVKSCGAAYLHPWFGTVDDALIESCHKAGVGLNVYTVDAPKDIQWLVRHGVDGIISNQPQLCQKLIAEG